MRRQTLRGRVPAGSRGLSYFCAACGGGDRHGAQARETRAEKEELAAAGLLSSALAVTSVLFLARLLLGCAH